MSCINCLYIAAQGKKLTGLGSRSSGGQKNEKPTKILVKQHVDRFMRNLTVHPVQWLDCQVRWIDNGSILAWSTTSNQTKKGISRQFDQLVRSIFKTMIFMGISKNIDGYSDTKYHFTVHPIQWLDYQVRWINNGSILA